jgi:hypothetical protein
MGCIRTPLSTAARPNNLYFTQPAVVPQINISCGNRSFLGWAARQHFDYPLKKNFIANEQCSIWRNRDCWCNQVNSHLTLESAEETGPAQKVVSYHYANIYIGSD